MADAKNARTLTLSILHHGLNSKPKANMNDHFDMMYDELDYLNIIHNLKKFKEINNLK